MGLHRAGFDVEGWDIAFQKRYPFKFHQGNALDVDLTGFGFVWASPPCQAHTPAKNIHGDPGYECFIVRTREKLKAWGGAWIIENVMGAPLENSGMLCGTMFGLKVFRHRRFESNSGLLFPAHSKHDGSTGAKDGYSRPGRNRNGFICCAGNNYDPKAGSAAMGIDWMIRSELSQAIPPAYSEFLGRQIMRVLGKTAPPAENMAPSVPLEPS
jgi:DNA (cytosine-5)-methyltransferase 1